MKRALLPHTCWTGGPRELVRLGRLATVGCSGELQLEPPLPPPPVAAPPRLAVSVAVIGTAARLSKKLDTSSLSLVLFLRRLIFLIRPT